MKTHLLLLLVLSSCAFKENGVPQAANEPLQEPSTVGEPVPSPTPPVSMQPETPKPIASPSPVQSSSLPPAEVAVEISDVRLFNQKGEQKQLRKVNLLKGEFIAEYPLTVSGKNPPGLHIVDDDLTLKLQVKNLKKETSQFEVEARSISPQELISIPKFDAKLDDNELTLKIFAYSEIFEAFNSRKIELSITLKTESKKTIFKVKVFQSPNQFEFKNIDFNSTKVIQRRFIDLATTKLSLIWANEFRSNEPIPVQIQFATRLKGNISTKTEYYDLKPEVCSYQFSKRTEETNFGEEFAILPLSNDFDNNLMLLALNNTHQVITVEPSQSVTFGLFAVGEKARELIVKEYQKTFFDTIEVATSCTARCGEWPNSGMFLRTNANMPSLPSINFWNQRGLPGASKDCIDLASSSWHPYASPVQRWTDQQPDEMKIARCAAWEVSNGTAPWDPNRFCKSSEPGNPFGHPAKEFWTFRKATQKLWSGKRTYPVTAQLLKSSFPLMIFHLMPEELRQRPMAVPKDIFPSTFELFN